MKRHKASTIRRMSRMHSGTGNPFFGRHHTPEVRAAMIARLKWHREHRKTFDIQPVTIKIPDPVLAAYVAGLVDGEGSIHFKKDQPTVYIYNTCFPLMRFLKRKIGGAIKKRSWRPTGTKPCYTWSIGGARNCASLIKAMRSSLIIKIREAEAMLDRLETKYRNRLWQNGQT